MVSPDVLLSSPRMTGARIKRMEDPKLITGGGTYVDDMKFVGLLHMQLVRSPYAHARIVSVNADAARQMPGVVAIYTGADVKGLGRHPANALPGMKVSERYLLAADKALHVGDPVVAVVAETRAQARDAAMAVEVQYEVLPSVESLDAATAEGAPQLHTDAPNNVAFRIPMVYGDIEQAFREADRVVNVRIEQPKLVGMFLEPRVSVAEWDKGQEKLTLHIATQSVHGMRSNLMAFFGLDELHCRVVTYDVGGGFGVKNGGYPDEYLVSFAARQLNRPVKYLEDRRDHFVQSGHGRGQVNYLEAAVKNDGTIIGVRARILADLGAYAFGGVFSHMQTLAMGVGVFKFQHLNYELVGTYTNSTPTTFYRGAGRPEAAYMLDRLAEVVAFDLGLDPVEVRKKNLIPADAFPYKTPTGRTYDSGNYEGALEKALEVSDYAGLRKWQEEQRAQGKVIGIGVSTYVEVTGGGPTPQGAARGGFESATIRVEPSGTVTVMTGSSPHGQGTATSFAQIVADALGVPMERIKVVHGDTDKVQMGVGTFGSRTMAVGATAVVYALSKIRDKVHKLAAVMLEANPDDITLEEEKFIVKGTPNKSLSLAEVARRAYAPWGIPRDIEPGLEATVFWEPTNFVYPFGAHLVVVEADKDTGKIAIRKFIAVDDVGKVISPLLMEGQVHGGVAQGVAAALYEQVVFDDSGQPVTATLMDYACIKADDLPSIDVIHHSTPSPVNPLGAKGVGESGTIGATPAVVNAVHDALKPFGARNIDMPLTPEKVWRAIHGQLDTTSTGSIGAAGEDNADPEAKRMIAELDPN